MPLEDRKHIRQVVERAVRLHDPNLGEPLEGGEFLEALDGLLEEAEDDLVLDRDAAARDLAGGAECAVAGSVLVVLCKGKAKLDPQRIFAPKSFNDCALSLIGRFFWATDEKKTHRGSRSRKDRGWSNRSRWSP